MTFLKKNASILLLLKGSLILLGICWSPSCSAISWEEDLTLTRQETEALAKFKSKVLPILPKSYMKNDFYLIRWLRARDLDIPAAVEMLKSNLQWRQQQKMDTILSEDWSDLTADYPFTNDKHDKEGRPLWTVNLGSWNFRKMALAGKMPRLQRYMSKLLEEGTQQVRQEQARGQNVTQWKILYNLDGFNQVEQGCPICLPAYTSFVSTYEERYPGFLDEAIHINTPAVYEIVLALIRPIFSPATNQAVKIFGHNKAEWGPYLDKTISRDERRVEYGGTLKD